MCRWRRRRRNREDEMEKEGRGGAVGKSGRSRDEVIHALSNTHDKYLERCRTYINNITLFACQDPAQLLVLSHTCYIYMYVTCYCTCMHQGSFALA